MRHPRSWQFRTVTPDSRGFWSAEGLRPGGYEIVVHGKVGGYDADWEYGLDLDAGQTISLPLTSPRFFRRVNPEAAQ